MIGHTDLDHFSINPRSIILSSFFKRSYSSWLPSKQTNQARQVDPMRTHKRPVSTELFLRYLCNYGRSRMLSGQWEEHELNITTKMRHSAVLLVLIGHEEFWLYMKWTMRSAKDTHQLPWKGEWFQNKRWSIIGVREGSQSDYYYFSPDWLG